VLYKQTGTTVLFDETGENKPATIIISEIYFDGYDERVELTNISTQNFSGELILRGVSTSPLVLDHIQILPAESIVISQNIDSFIDPQCIWLSGASLKIQDDASITASLQSGSEILDTFQVHVDYVTAINDQKTSFEKVLFADKYIVTPSIPMRNSNIISGYTANPGTFFSVDQAPIDAGTGIIET
jgi:hypothetical protein